MRSSWILPALVALVSVPAPARAQFTFVDSLLVEAPTQEAVRESLLAHGESLAASDPLEAARAFGYRGDSFAREGQTDSAVACRERALALDPRRPRRMELAEALIARLGPGDAARAREVLRPAQPDDPEHWTLFDVPYQAMFAWTHYLTGRSDSAATLFGPIDARISPEPEWRYRMACVALERSDWVRAMNLLTPLAVVSRERDSDVMGMAARAASELGVRRHLKPLLARELMLRDAVEGDLLTDLGARRVDFTAWDGFPLGGVLLAPRRPGARAAVVLLAPGDTLAECDSLAIGLRRLGFALLLLEPRGTGHSRAEGCPSPETWRGREEEMLAREAMDVRDAVATLGREAGADTTGYLLGAIGAMGPAAALAAAHDPRVRALLLVSPSPAPVDRGSMRAALAEARRPVYFQTGGEDTDYANGKVLDFLYRACDPRASRIADSEQIGERARLFRHDPRIMERFRLWLEDAWPSARRAPPRAAPR